jgi:hypothetical protein
MTATLPKPTDVTQAYRRVLDELCAAYDPPASSAVDQVCVAADRSGRSQPSTADTNVIDDGTATSGSELAAR